MSEPSTRPSSPALDRAAAFANGTKRILIADDNRDWTDALALLLKDEGYSVRSASDRREAIEVAREFQPHVVILDVCMPKFTGYEAARIFTRDPAGIRPVLVAIPRRATPQSCWSC